ncbi:MAG: SCP2 sterol-binding domain-containing protein [Actinomycetota bacterium]|nr:SCP2 sterol-binding domain-containing protein [Actinomycetota bacterium]
MARFLSPDWIAEASATAAASDELAAPTAGVTLVVQQVVTGGPDGEVRYVVTIDDGHVALRAGEDGEADVTFTLDWDTAVAMATGGIGGQEAFTSGRLRMRGDVGVLLRHGPTLAGLSTVFAGLRERTTY